MNSEFEGANVESKSDAAGFLKEAAETFLANLPLLVCGLVVGLAVAFEITG